MLSPKIMSSLRKNIKKFTWSTCMEYRVKSNRDKYCNLLFTSELDIKSCQYQFCPKCCSHFTDITNKVMRNLCEQTCSIVDDEETTNKSWYKCATPTFPTKSIYQYCDNLNSDDYSQGQCKIDMCNLCCAKYEFNSKVKISRANLDLCYSICERSRHNLFNLY